MLIRLLRLATTALLLSAASLVTLHADVYVADTATLTVDKLNPAGGTPATFASGFGNPLGLALDAAGNLYVADYSPDTGVGTVYKESSTGTQTVFATGFVHTAGLAFDHSGNLFVSSVDAGQTSGTIYEVTPTGAVSTFAAVSGRPRGLVFDAAGNLYAADLDAGDVYKFTPAGVMTTFATGFNYPTGLAFDASGNLFLCSQGVGVFEVTPAGVVSSFTTNVTDPRWLAFDATGNLYVTDVGDASGDPGQGTVYLFTPAGVRTTVATGLDFPTGVAVGGAPTVAAAPTATVAATTDSTELGGAPGVFTVTLSSPATAKTVVAYKLAGTAVNGTDYSLLKGTVKIKAGKTSASVQVIPQAPNGVPTAKKSVKLTLEPGTGYTVGTAATAKVKIDAGQVIILP